MFSFEPIDRCIYNGIEYVDSCEYTEQRFVLHFGDKSLDNKFFLVLSRDNIRFFYYDRELLNPQGILYADLLKELGCISLTHPKDTGNDILHFPQMACGSIEHNIDIQDKELSVLRSLKGLLYNFPFWQDIEGREREWQNYLMAITKCCLLIFVFEIEDRNEKFAISPLYDNVRTLLRKSDVYKLLCAKLKYTLYIPQNHFAYNSDEYSYKAQVFADCLMDKHINKVISPHDYPSKKRKVQYWFNHPEKELESILKQNRIQEYSSEVTKTLLDDTLVLKIRDFLYTKHAIYQAMTKTIGKQFFLCGQFFMAVTTISLLCAFLQTSWFDNVMRKLFPLSLSILCLSLVYQFANNEWKKKTYLLFITKYAFRFQRLWIIVPLLVLCILSWASISSYFPIQLLFICDIVFIITCIFISGYFNKVEKGGNDGILYAFFPRILVAELAAWLTIGIAEDLVKSMLWVNQVGIVLGATIAVLILVGLIIGGEVKQHSPYLSLGKNIFQRTIPIINHSLFFGLIFGMATQMFFYNNLIKTSDVMPSVVFNNYFDDANYYCQNLIDLETAIKQYEDFSHTSSLKGLSMTGKGIGAQTTQINDTDLIKISLTLDQEIESNYSPNNSASHNSIVKNIEEIVKEIRKLDADMGICSSFLYKSSLCYLNDSINSIEIENKYISQNIEKVIALPIYLQKEITCIRRSINKYNDYDTLMNWATVDYKPFVNTGSAYLDCLTKKIQQKHKCSRTTDTILLGKQRFFPTLLIFHTLIVLVLAFVTQLIISDKSVTGTL